MSIAIASDTQCAQRYDFTLGLLLPLHGELRRKYRHPQAYRRLMRSLAEEIRYAAGVRGREPMPFAVAMVTRHSPIEPDPDNLYASAKPLLDVLQPPGPRYPFGLGLIVGDAPHQIELVCNWRQAPKNRGYTRVSLYPE